MSEPSAETGDAPCPGMCDHCAPDGWEECARPVGHFGLHNCQPGEEEDDA